MADKLAVDFGNSNTVLSVWNSEKAEPQILSIPEYSAAENALIPSLIHYENDGRRLIGDQILRMGLEAAPGTFKWMKRYINLRSPYTMLVGGRRIQAKQAAEDFLNAVFMAAKADADIDLSEITMSVPLESFEYYENWLLTQAELSGFDRIRLVDEAAAAAAGYGAEVHPGDVLLILDFGGSTFQAEEVLILEKAQEEGRYGRVLAKSESSLGGSVIDRWLMEDFLERNSLSSLYPGVLQNSRRLLEDCERLKIHLSDCGTDRIRFDAGVGNFYETEYSRGMLNEVLEKHRFFENIHSVAEQTVLSAADQGFPENKITHVIPVGGGSQIPALLDQIKRDFGMERVLTGEPMGAAARGAACIAGGLDLYDFIQHRYAVRYRDRSSGEYSYQTIVESGTHYPTKEAAAVFTVRAVYDNQERMGLAVYESSPFTDPLESEKTEIIFDKDGRVHLLAAEEPGRNRKMFWLNERNTAFLKTGRKVIKGEKCFRVSFEIGPDKMLLMSAEDLYSGNQVYNQLPVIRLN